MEIFIAWGVAILFTVSYWTYDTLVDPTGGYKYLADCMREYYAPALLKDL